MTDSAARPTSRRALLAGAAGGALAVAAASLARPEPVAAVDTPMLLNTLNSSNKSTYWVAGPDENVSLAYGLSMNATPTQAASMTGIRGAATHPLGDGLQAVHPAFAFGVGGGCGQGGGGERQASQGQTSDQVHDAGLLAFFATRRMRRLRPRRMCAGPRSERGRTGASALQPIASTTERNPL